ncbi:MAG TPA: hypothetical protein VMI12_10995 [Puia sp.]|nr:hypothetical protein [Puia sp.]
MKNLKLVSILFSVVILATVGCQKGSTGPQGPPGPDSVIYSSWITLNTPYNSADSGYEEILTANSITQDIIDKGIILTYIDPNGDGNIFPTASVGFAISETYSVGAISIFSLVDLSGFEYRYVVIAGSMQGNKVVSGPAKGMTREQLQTMSYEAVQKLAGTSSKSGSN